MTAKTIVPVLAAVAAGLLSFSITRYATCRGDERREGDRLTDLSFLRSELRLTDRQLEEIAIYHDELALRLSDICARHCSARVELGLALASETNGCMRVDAALNELSRAYEDSERVALDHIRRVREVLEPAQRERFDQLLKECLCRECPACGMQRDPVASALHEH